MVTIRYMVGAATIIPISVFFSLSPSLSFSLSHVPFSFSPSFSPSLPLWLSFDLRAMLAALRPGSCGQEPHLPLPRAGPSEEDRRESFISHFLLWESGSAEAQLEPAHWARIAQGWGPRLCPNSSYPYLHVLAMPPLTFGACPCSPAQPACVHTCSPFHPGEVLPLSGSLALCPGPPAATSFLTGKVVG